MDEALEAVGSSGKYQIILATIIIFASPMALLLSLSFPLFTSLPKFTCLDLPTNTFLLCSHQDYCLKDNLSRSIDYSKSINNFVLEFELYCEDEYFIGLIASSYFIGVITGTIMLSRVPDIFGREKIFKILVFGNLFICFTLIFCFSVYHFIVVNFLAGIFSYIIVMTPLFSSEFLDILLNGIVLSVMCAANSTCGVLVTLFFVFVNDWKLLFVIVTIFNTFLFILSYKYIIESPRWLFSQNRKRDSYCILQQMSKINNKSFNLQMFIKTNPIFLESNRNTRTDLFQINFMRNLTDEDIQKLNDLKDIRRKEERHTTYKFTFDSDNKNLNVLQVKERKSDSRLNLKSDIKEMLRNITDIGPLSIRKEKSTFDNIPHLHESDSKLPTIPEVSEKKKDLSKLNNFKLLSVLEILNIKSQQKNLYICTYLSFAFGIFFNGLFLNLDHLGDSVIKSNLVYFLSEGAGFLISGYFADFFGRINSIKVFCILGGVSFFLFELVTDPNINLLFLLLSGFSFAGIGNIITIYNSEIFPTIIRSTVMGFLFLVSQLGGIFVPFVSFYIPHNPLLYGMIAFLSFFPCLYLPETLGSQLSDNLPEEIEDDNFISNFEDEGVYEEEDSLHKPLLN